jgi:hypothetical protein
VTDLSVEQYRSRRVPVAVLFEKPDHTQDHIQMSQAVELEDMAQEEHRVGTSFTLGHLSTSSYCLW